MTAQIIALSLAGLFYTVYLQRQFALRRRGIRADRLGRGEKPRATRAVEIVLLSVPLTMPVVQVASVLCRPVVIPLWLSVAGAVIGTAGVAFFLLAVVAMHDNWRAGIDAAQKTELFIGGVYRISHNPAFVGFDLFYIGIAAMFPNPVLIALTLAGIVLLHLQILQEERYAPGAFGQAYIDYRRKTRRYL